MFKKNRIWNIVVALVLCISALAGCASNKTTDTTSQSSSDNADKKSIVCTIFPEYDWAREVVGSLSEDYELTLLLDNGVDLHSYQPTAADIAKIAACDLFVYVGGESDGWVEDALKEAVNQNMQVINLLDVLGDTVKEEEVVEGMQGEEDSEEGEEEPEYDEHVWLSLKNAQTLTIAIADALAQIDPDHADEFQANCNQYVQQLGALNLQYEEAVAAGSADTVVFGDRFPFRYLVDDYNLNYYAAFVGCSAETEASFETIVFLAGKMDELGLGHILVIESSDQKIAKTIISNTTEQSQDILVMDSMQSTTSKDIADGETYLSAMERNLEVLKTALE